jgi:TolB-like protein
MILPARLTAMKWSIQLALILLLPVPVSVAETVRLAITADQPALAPTADLLTVAFAANQQVELVERAQLDRVLREQAAAVAHGEGLLKLGELLSADGLVVLDRITREKEEFLAARLIAVKPGVTLAVETMPWPLTKPVEWGQRLVPTLARFFPKLSVLKQDAVPVSILNLRSALRTPESESLERELTLLLIHRLTREPQLFVLERQRLAEALFETELAPTNEAAFWTGRYLIDGVLDKNGYDPQRVAVSLRLVSPEGGGTTAIEVSGPRHNLPAVVESLAEKILTRLRGVNSASDWRPSEEAEQFEDEARWAIRWGLWAEAQMASESAWALGRHTPAVAALRIRAYGDNIVPVSPGTGNIIVPGQPDPAKLRPARRAVELFCENAALFFTNSLPTNTYAFTLGFEPFRSAVALLDGFYNVAELRVGHETDLAELRSALRHLEPLLGRLVPTNANFQLAERFKLVKWNQAGVLFDRPEDAPALFRQMLEDNYHPEGLPLILGWTWEDRQRVPLVMRQFIENLRTSTNTNARLEGLYLAVVREPFDAAGRFQAYETELVSAIWENRTAIMADPKAATILERTREVLRKKYRYIYHGAFPQEPYAGFMQRLRQDYLMRSTNWNENVFRELFPGDDIHYRPAEAAELAPLFAPFKQRFAAKHVGSRIDGVYNQMQRVAGSVNRASSDSPAPKPVAFAQLFPALRYGGGVETLRFVPWQLPRKDEFDARVLKLIQRDGKLWAMIRYLSGSGAIFGQGPTTFAMVDPVSGRSEAIAFPGAAGFPDAEFEVTGDSLFVSVHDHLQRYRFQSRRWEKVAVPIANGARILAVRDRILLATGESLLEYNPTNQAVQVLASSRRRPAENELDSLWSPQVRMFAWPDDLPGLQLANAVFVQVRDSRQWQRTELPLGRHNTRLVPVSSDQGLKLLVNEFGGHERIVAFRQHGRQQVLLLEKEKAQQWGGRRSTWAQALGAARWQWPKQFDLEYASLLAEGDVLWNWQPRQIERFPPVSTPETVVYPDDRRATLLRFEPGRKDPLPLAIRFEKEGQPHDPFDPKQNSPMGFSPNFMDGPPTPHFLSIPEGLIVVNWAVPGHWIVPRARLDAKLREIREKLGADATGGGAK